ncbi:MAG: phosphatase PAP2 family protein [Hyphomicrobiaceae bacterium]
MTRGQPVQSDDDRRQVPVELEVLVGIGIVLGGLCLFFAVAVAMSYGGLATVDRAILLSLRTPGDLGEPIGPLWFEGFVRDITALGSFAVLGLLVTSVTGLLALNGRPQRALVILAYVLSGNLVGELAKRFFARPRPDLVPHSVDVMTLSFPSAHAMQASVVYLTLAALLAATQTRPGVKAYVLGVAALLALMVGMSRVYLGVHWPSDVLAGWSLGTAWATGCWLLDRHLRGKRQQASGE